MSHTPRVPQACVQTAHEDGTLVIINGNTPATVYENPVTIRRECEALRGLLVVGGSIALILGLAGIATMIYLHQRCVVNARAQNAVGGGS